MFLTSVSGVPTTIKPDAPKMSSSQRAAVLAFAAVIVGVAVWGLTACNRDGDPSSSASTPISGDARIVSESDLAGLPEEVGHQVFWAGPQSDSEMEFSHDESGNVHLRYLTGGTEAGDPNQGFLNIGTYPFTGAYEATKKLANGPGLVKINEGSGVGFFDPANPYSVIIAWPDQPDLQIEVYDPQPNRALEFVRSGDIVPVS